MKTVSLTRVLEYYYLPLVFEGEDEGGQRYICDSLFTTQEGGEVFLAVAVRTPRSRSSTAAICACAAHC